MSDSKIILKPNGEQLSSFVKVQQALVLSLETLIQNKVEELKTNNPEYKISGLSQATMLSKSHDWISKIGIWSNISISSQDFKGFYFTFGIGQENLCYIYSSFQNDIEELNSEYGFITFDINQNENDDLIFNCLIDTIKEFGDIYNLDIDKNPILLYN